MIKNILFDMGNVLVRWDPEGFVDDLGLDNTEDKILLYREVYATPSWVSLDRGTIGNKEMWEIAQKNLPERLHDYAKKLIYNWPDKREEIPGMYNLVKELMDKGYKTYLLTNASREHHTYWPKYKIAELFKDRIMLSSDWLILKPDPAFYLKALDMFNLKAEECVFIDDNPANVEAAERLGIKGIVSFQDAELLRNKLRKLNVNI